MAWVALASGPSHGLSLRDNGFANAGCAGERVESSRGHGDDPENSRKRGRRRSRRPNIL